MRTEFVQIAKSVSQTFGKEICDKCWETRMGTDKPVEENRTGWNPTESVENRKQGLICKYVLMRLLRLYL